jgi:ADP-ribosyl-[dinitrogen reductase] hydrolase
MCGDTDWGRGTSVIAARLIAGAHRGPTHANDDENGSIMRLAPAAVRWWRQPEFAEMIAERQSVTTHGAPEAVAGCSLLVRVLCRAIAGDGWNSIFFDNERWPPLICAVGQGASISRSQAKISSSGYVVHTLEAPYWACKRSSNFEEAILTAANLGNDADTVAAVVGQISGAVWGFSAIPTRAVGRLQIRCFNSKGHTALRSPDQ